ncbi:MAG: hypothetical protein AAGA77_25920 [Bacteroidota bacterium]
MKNKYFIGITVLVIVLQASISYGQVEAISDSISMAEKIQVFEKIRRGEPLDSSELKLPLYSKFAHLENNESKMRMIQQLDVEIFWFDGAKVLDSLFTWEGKQIDALIYQSDLEEPMNKLKVEVERLMKNQHNLLNEARELGLVVEKDAKTSRLVFQFCNDSEIEDYLTNYEYDAASVKKLLGLCNIENSFARKRLLAYCEKTKKAYSMMQKILNTLDPEIARYVYDKNLKKQVELEFNNEANGKFPFLYNQFLAKREELKTKNLQEKRFENPKTCPNY